MVGGRMEVIYIKKGEQLPIKEKINACIGYFDGIHRGHQALIKQAKKRSKDMTLPVALITFEPDPWTILKKEQEITHLTSMETRIELGKSLGIQFWIILTFDEALAQMNIDEFHSMLAKDLHINTLICGYDFHYAKNGSGDVHSLKKQTLFQVDIIDEVEENGAKISSSRIEKAIMNGNMEEAYDLLGRCYEIKGLIIKGNQIGRTIGFPTINLQMDDTYVIPKRGVYIGRVKLNGHLYEAMINVGHNPTLNYQKQISIEAYILDFNQDVYGQKANLQFIKFIRAEMKFQTAEALIQQMNQDKLQTIHYFKQ